ncbi:MAG: DNA metabolism protein [Chitinophagaceae bacterium]|nr:MAG: DNA metabolism protein [Chitinophagaceae bacterium]
MQTVLYDGTFEGWLCAVFDVYDYRFEAADICRRDRFQGNIFGTVHEARMNEAHARRVWRGLERKLSAEGLQQVYRCFLADEAEAENMLLRYVRYVFGQERSVEQDFSNADVLAVSQTARRVWKEQHRMEAFVRFQKTADGLFYALIEPDHDVLPLIAKHFTARYADQRWLIYDGRRRYGIHFDGACTHTVEIQFAEAAGGERDVAAVYDPEEAFYQQLWQQYFKSVNIAARKNTRLQVQHMPRRYWKYLVETQAGVPRR